MTTPRPEPRRSHRRDFLTGRAAVNAVENVIDSIRSADREAERETSSAAAPEESYLLQFGRDAMAVEFQVFLNASADDSAGPEAAIAALDLVERLESQLTVYRESSEMSRLNREAYEREFALEPRLCKLLQTALRISEETGGAYDMTSGPLSKIWGFYRREGRMPADAEIATALSAVGHGGITLDEERRTIRFSRAGMEINLGGIGKGYALDRAAESLSLNGVSDFLLHGGNSSVLARGSRTGRAGWSVGLNHPVRSDRRLAEFRLQHRALGTSGSGTQFFHHGGKKYGHILDPRSGRPAEGILSSTVLAPTAAEADALSTAFYVGGVSLAKAYCEKHPHVSALLVSEGRRAGELELHPIALRNEDWRAEE